MRSKLPVGMVWEIVQWNSNFADSKIADNSTFTDFSLWPFWSKRGPKIADNSKIADILLLTNLVCKIGVSLYYHRSRAVDYKRQPLLYYMHMTCTTRSSWYWKLEKREEEKKKTSKWFQRITSTTTSAQPTATTTLLRKLEEIRAKSVLKYEQIYSNPSNLYLVIEFEKIIIL